MHQSYRECSTTQPEPEDKPVVNTAAITAGVGFGNRLPNLNDGS